MATHNTKTLKLDKSMGILAFDLTEDREQFEAAAHGMDWALLVADLDEYLRSRIKHGELPEPGEAELQAVRDRIHEEMSDRGLNFPS